MLDLSRPHDNRQQLFTEFLTTVFISLDYLFHIKEGKFKELETRLILLQTPVSAPLIIRHLAVQAAGPFFVTPPTWPGERTLLLSRTHGRFLDKARFDGVFL